MMGRWRLVFLPGRGLRFMALEDRKFSFLGCVLSGCRPSLMTDGNSGFENVVIPDMIELHDLMSSGHCFLTRSPPVSESAIVLPSL
jgi:hypothetical protein